jgi:hypothetical protein
MEAVLAEINVPSSTNAPSLQRSSLLRDDANDGTIELEDEDLHKILRNLLAFRGIGPRRLFRHVFRSKGGCILISHSSLGRFRCNSSMLIKPRLKALSQSLKSFGLSLREIALEEWFRGGDLSRSEGLSWAMFRGLKGVIAKKQTAF